jgi:hypothetical protein
VAAFKQQFTKKHVTTGKAQDFRHQSRLWSGTLLPCASHATFAGIKCPVETKLSVAGVTEPCSVVEVSLPEEEGYVLAVELWVVEVTAESLEMALPLEAALPLA